MMPPAPPLTVLITGASGGIGAELATLFARDGHRLVLVARSEKDLTAKAEELQKAHHAETTVIPCDLSLPDAARTLVEQLQKRGVAIDVLVNNAGFGAFGLFAEGDIAVTASMLQVNVSALTLLTRLLLPAMVERKRGYVLNVASTAAFQPGPLMSVYYASKAYVLSFSEGIRSELAGTGVSVTCLCPGPTKTGFQTHAGMQKSRLFAAKVMDAATVARAAYKGLWAGKGVVIPGWSNACLAFATRLVPRSFAAAMARRAQASR